MLTAYQIHKLRSLIPPGTNPVSLTESERNAIDAVLAELDALRVAGDRLAAEAYQVAEYNLDGPALDRMRDALATWAAARGGSGSDSGAGATQQARGDDR